MTLKTVALMFAAILFPFSLLASPAGVSASTSTNTPPKCESTDPKVKIDLTCIENQLKTTGLGGWVHAAVEDQLLLVFTWRRPGNFFVNMQFPMASKDPKILKALTKLHRHDQIVIKGEFFKNDAPLEHINVTELKVVKPYTGPQEKYNYDPNLPDEILSGTDLIGKVHAVANGGSVLVIEVGDRVYPVFNEKPELAANLFRNDKIELQYTIQFDPMRPTHLAVNTLVQNPIRVMERIEEGHGTPIKLTGPLVMFPQSPQIMFNVFALRTVDSDDVKRNFTIVNFEDTDLFLAIRDKLQKAWDDHQSSAEYDRNKYINRKIILTVEGTKNVVAPNQANPQIIPASINDVKIQFL